MNQEITPLYDALQHHIKKKPISLHVPGHKSGLLFPERGIHSFKNILQLDTTELTGLDDLHEPTEAIEEAEVLLARLYGASRSYFLVNGTTVGNLAMVLAVCKEDEVVLVQRNCHKSIINGLIIAGAKPIFLSPEFDWHLQAPTYVHERVVIEALRKYKKAKAVILTNPNYYGHTYGLKNIIKYAHDKGIPVLVDEAHGAHFGVGEGFPESSLLDGADIVVQSAHKTLPAMTMGSFLHFQSKLVSEERLTFYLNALQSSSPSYPIMASLDLARYYLAKIKKKGVREILQQSVDFNKKIAGIPQLSVIQTNDENCLQDPLKVTIQSKCHLSGYELQALLEKERIFTELADPFNVLCILPLGEFDMIDRIVGTMKQALQGVEPTTMPEYNKDMLNTTIQSMNPFSYFDLKKMKKTMIHIHNSIGRISAQTVIPYPPGIPLIMQGEVITNDHLEQLTTLIRLGAKFQGGIANCTISIYVEGKEEKIK